MTVKPAATRFVPTREQYAWTFGGCEPVMRIQPGEILEYLRPKLARWALPDEVVLIEAVPKTSVGKFDKKVLRERFKSWTPRS